MTLISVLVALVLDRLLLSHRDGPVGSWFGRSGAAVAARLPTGQSGTVGAVIQVVAVIALPVIAVVLVQWWIEDWLFGLVGLAFGIAVLLFSLGPLDIVNLIDHYLDARRQHDRERADWYFERITGEAPAESASAEGRRMVEAVFHQGHDHLFATVFWFCIFGPAGAVLYRMTAEVALRPPPVLVARPELSRIGRRALGILGWIPARLVAFGYAMTGGFEEAFRRFRRGFDTDGDLLAANRALLIATGTAALRRDPDERADDEAANTPERRSGDPAEVVEAARALALRTAVLWLAVLALLTLTGWFS